MPPCEDATMWAVKAKALEYKFRGLQGDSDQGERANYGADTWRGNDQASFDARTIYKALADLDTEKFQPKCTPRKNHFVAMVSVSRTIDTRVCHGSACPPRPREAGEEAQKVQIDSLIPQLLSKSCSDEGGFHAAGALLELSPEPHPLQLSKGSFDVVPPMIFKYASYVGRK